jgi:arylsulfatase A-like enzyme
MKNLKNIPSLYPEKSLIYRLITIIFLVTSSNSCSTLKNHTSVKRPNIIFLLTDDQRWDALGVNGNTLIQTPHLDRLADHGLNFTNAYVTTSICMVSRASILTGQYMSRHGINDFHQSISAEALQKTYPFMLKKEGYRIGFVGKYGVGNPKDQPKELFDFWAGTPMHQPNYETIDADGDSIHYTDLLSNGISDFIKMSTSAKPFCLLVSFKSPHSQDGDARQFIPKKKYEDLYNDIEIPEPYTAKPQYWDSLPDFFHTEENIARNRWKLRFDTPEKYQKSVKNYYRLITGVDDAVGKMIAQLKKQGLEKNTIIIFMGDNGFYLGEHGLAGKWFGHEESIRVPLFIYDPRNSAESGNIEKIALNIDIAPTILGYAGIKPPFEMQGVDLVKLVKGQIADRKQFFYEHTFQGSPQLPKVEGVVSPILKYMYYPEHDYEELFDLKKDPYEINNLVNDSGYSKILQEQRGLYRKLKKKAE